MVKELSKFYGAVLRSPWMSEGVKLSLKISRRDILLLSQLIEKGLLTEEAKAIVPTDAFEGLRAIAADFLAKAEVPEEFSLSFKELVAGKSGS